MSWVKLDDRYFSNGKIRRVSIEARLLHVASMCHCAAALNDGEIPIHDVVMVQAAAGVMSTSAIDELVRVGLWDPIFDECNGNSNGVGNAVTGYRVHDYLEYNPPSAKVEESREKTRARVEKYRKSKGNGVSNGVTTTVTNGVSNAAPVPVPVPVPDPRPVQSEIKICAETAKPSSSPPLLVFPCDGPVSEWKLTDEQVREWSELFPSRDILTDCRAALAWVKAAPSRRKTHHGMTKFLVGWISRNQDRGSGNQQRKAPGEIPTGWKAGLR